MMKILVLGDIHGREFWKEIIEKEDPDLVIFLGDYVSTHQLISEEQQIRNLKEILTYKEENPDKVILLRGNHDIQHLGYYWAECSGYFPKVAHWMSEPENKERYLKDTQWLYIDEDLKVIFSHAGVSKVWLEETIIPYLDRTVYPVLEFHLREPLRLLNQLQPDEKFGFIPDSPFDYCGESDTQPLTWIRPGTLAKCMVEGYTQVVGHTPVKRDCTNVYKITKGNQHLWLCDGLGTGSYLVIEDGEFIVKNVSDNDN